jgi:hypothetical protein
MFAVDEFQLIIDKHILQNINYLLQLRFAQPKCARTGSININI